MGVKTSVPRESEGLGNRLVHVEHAIEVVALVLDHHRGKAEKLEGHFVLWKANGNPEHLTEAHRLLTELVEHAPEEYRESMIENIPLNREIMQAWEEHGA